MLVFLSLGFGNREAQLVNSMLRPLPQRKTISYVTSVIKSNNSNRTYDYRKSDGNVPVCDIDFTELCSKDLSGVCEGVRRHVTDLLQL